MGRRLVLSLSFAVAATSFASADDLPPPFAPSIVEIRLNDQPEGATLIVRRDAGGALRDLWQRAGDRSLFAV